MWASRGTKFSSMNEAVSSSSYDSASSRAHAPQAGAALKSTSSGCLLVFASASAASASLSQCTFISSPPSKYYRRKKAQKYGHKKAHKAQMKEKLFVPFVPFGG